MEKSTKFSIVSFCIKFRSLQGRGRECKKSVGGGGGGVVTALLKMWSSRLGLFYNSVCIVKNVE